MCGICGVYNFDNNPETIQETDLLAIRDAMIHRGPDDAGSIILKNRKLGFGHRRLSIIDLSPKGKQPMTNENGTIWIVFNGEIYNFKVLREKLILNGHVFKSNSDTEVIIHLFEDKGIKCIDELEGEFAFAIFDGNKNKLWLVRDRIGVKPIYYYFSEKRIVFASEIKAILTDNSIPRAVNEEALYHYLSFLTTPAPQTLFQGIQKIPGGFYLEILSDGTHNLQRYWDVLDNVNPKNGVSEENISATLNSELRKTISDYKLSDVPVGVFLSGGLDSSINAILFSEKEKNKIKTFTIGYQGDNKSYVNEFEYAKIVADLIQSEHHEKAISEEELMNFLPKMIYYQDEPIADPVCVPVYFVSKLARESGIVVCQVGEGSDELFWGYPKWKLAIFLEKLNKITPNFIKKSGLNLLKLLGKTRGLPYEGLSRGLNGSPLFWGGAEAFTEQEKKYLLSERLRQKFSDYSSYQIIEPIWNNFQNKSWEKTSLNWMTYLDINLRLPELLLMRVDKMSMSVSLEARVPFLSRNIVEFAMSIPTSLKMKNNDLKYILKRAFNNEIPPKIIQRKKQGFGVPIYDWILQNLGDFAQQKIIDFTDRTDYFDKKEIQFILNERNANKIWYILNFVLWYECWIEKNSVEIY
jgi:asparagine synthase (glutamine-hydrolysing)